MRETLYNTEGSSNKIYVITVEPCGDNTHKVICYNGRRGGTLATQVKTPAPVSFPEAKRVAEKIRTEKMRGGYRPGDGAAAAPMQAPPSPTRATAPAPPLVDHDYRPMLLTAITDPAPYLASSLWIMQRKEDGVRAVVFVSSGTALAYSRNDLPVTLSAASVKVLCELFAECVVDVEVIGDYVVVFDILRHHGTDLGGYSCEDRLRALESKFAPFQKRVGPVRMIQCARLSVEKHELLATLRADGSEGAVFKLASARYSAGRSKDAAFKLKFKARASVRVSAIGEKGKESVSIELADGTPIGKVSTIGKPVPPVGSTIEVEYLYCLRGGRLMQAVYLNIRTDVEPDNAEALQYKGETREDN